MTYSAGQGYKDGHGDRTDGRSSRNPYGSGTSDDPYWREYKTGYFEADREIMENARRTVKEEKKFLAEDDRWSVDQTDV